MATFHDHLIASRWLLGLLGVKNLSTLSFLDNARFEGISSSGETHFFHALFGNRGNLFDDERLPEHDLRRYDLNIVRHWQTITEQRNRLEGHILHLKYFQYLSLLCAEIYLDWYFNRRERLLAELNGTLAQYKKEKHAEQGLPEYTADDLNKAAFWNATGSGKTLLMHVNILQYREYHGGKIDNLLVLTPNEGLSRQHLAELELSGLDAMLFEKNGGDLFKSAVQIIDIHKLGDKDGDKTVGTAAFEGDNLVLVDEGHSGASGEEWLKRRREIISRGFAFEYSATFGQAAGNSFKGKNKGIFGTYAKAVLFDYSYKYFYSDGYGKEQLILNMAKESYQDDVQVKQYLTACLLGFYQQLWLFERHKQTLAAWNLAKPLWIFVGRTVADRTGKNESKDQKQEKSDVRAVVDYFAYFLNYRTEIERCLKSLLANEPLVLDGKGNSVFHNRFLPLNEYAGKEQELYLDIIKRLFHADGVQRLHLEKRSKKDVGELVLRVGNHQPFAVINIGDAGGFFSAAAADTDSEFETLSDDFSDGLFDSINDTDSTVNVLIGSRKFSEGWSSWRVSTMGLLNVGQKEGSQIIQLFGRGVRLKGYGFSLKRSKAGERPKGAHLEKLETLNIFGVNAGYMDEFKKYLHEEGITPSDEVLTLDFATKPRLPETIKLTTLRLKDGYKDNQINGFKRRETAWLYEIPANWQGKIKAPHAVLDLYPRIQAIGSLAQKTKAETDKREKTKLSSQLFDLFDWEAVYLSLWDYKLKNSYSNMRLDKAKIRAFAEANDWYTLYAPKSDLAVRSFADVLKQQNILIELLQLYCDSFYNRLKGAYEGQFYETVELSEDYQGLYEHYRISIEAQYEHTDIYHQRLQELKDLVEHGEIKNALNWYVNDDLHVINIEPHLYYPLIKWTNVDNVPLKIAPIPIKDNSELRFVQDLQNAINNKSLDQWTDGRDLYLLRNASNKSKGLGFALAGNFYPDFLLWLVDKEMNKQWLTFIDPKGLLHMDLTDAKIGLAEEIKTLEAKINAPNLTLNSVILSVTPFTDLLNIQDWSEDKLREKNVLFMDKPDYLEQLFVLITQKGTR